MGRCWSGEGRGAVRCFVNNEVVSHCGLQAGSFPRLSSTKERLLLRFLCHCYVQRPKLREMYIHISSYICSSHREVC